MHKPTTDQTRLLARLRGPLRDAFPWVPRVDLFYGDRPFDLATFVSLSAAGWAEEQGFVVRLTVEGEAALATQN